MVELEGRHSMKMDWVYKKNVLGTTGISASLVLFI